jgi:hypothetical protein
MRTPQDDLSILARNSIDTYSFVIACFMVVLFMGWKAACAAAVWSSKRLLDSKGKLA